MERRYDYTGRPLGDNEVLVLMPFDALDVAQNCKRHENIVTVRVGGKPVPAVLKAIDRSWESEAKKQFNHYARELYPDLRLGLCLIKQPDGTEKECPKKRGDNRIDCGHCPHRGELERAKKYDLSFDLLSETDEQILGVESSPEQKFEEAEAAEEAFDDVRAKLEEIIAASPKAGLAVILMALGINGAEFSDQMKLQHDAACYLRNRIRELAGGHIDSFSGIDTSKMKFSRSKNDAYYAEEAGRFLDTLMEMYASL